METFGPMHYGWARILQDSSRVLGQTCLECMCMNLLSPLVRAFDNLILQQGHYCTLISEFWPIYLPTLHCHEFSIFIQHTLDGLCL